MGYETRHRKPHKKSKVIPCLRGSTISNRRHTAVRWMPTENNRARQTYGLRRTRIIKIASLRLFGE